jgi:hypothetical protein
MNSSHSVMLRNTHLYNHCDLSQQIVKPHYKTKQIRNRISYHQWKVLIGELKKVNSTEEIARLMWFHMDDRFMFSTGKQSAFEAESMEQVLLDISQKKD